MICAAATQWKIILQDFTVLVKQCDGIWKEESSLSTQFLSHNYGFLYRRYRYRYIQSGLHVICKTKQTSLQG